MDKATGIRLARTLIATWLVLQVAAFAKGPAKSVTAPLEPFLGPSDFEGSFTPATAPVLLGLQSTYSGTVALTMADRDVVAKMLPPGLLLAQPIARPGGAVPTRHPVLHMIGDQRQPALVIGGVATPAIGKGYQEMIWIVPFVVRGGADQWHNFVVRMYLDDIIPVLGGNEYFGYAKELARLQRKNMSGERRYTIISTDRATIWFRDAIELSAGSPPVPPPRWQDVRTVLSMPVLGLRPASLGVPDLWLCSSWELDLSKAKIAATSSHHQVVTAFTPGMTDWTTMGVLSNAQGGAFSLRRVRWRLAAAQPC